ncbi:MAG: ABC transporter permease, partial [Flavobacteriales bacterium]
VYKIPGKISQFKVFFIRDILSKLANTQYMLINFLEAPLLAIILSYMVKFYSTESGPDSEYVFRYNENLTAYLFMSVVVALFLGLTVSAEEIIRDQKILKRERFLNLSKSSYLISKVTIMFIISAIQTFTYVIIGNTILDIQGLNFDYWMILFVTSCFANMLGLNISSAFDSVVTIYILIPIILIPQLLLSGVIVKFDKLNPTLASQTTVPMAGELMTSRWAFEALAVNQFKENEFEKEYYPINKVISHISYKKNYWIKELNKNLEFCEKHFGKPEKAEESKNKWQLIRTELAKKDAQTSYEKPYQKNAPRLPENPTLPAISETDKYLKTLLDFYINLNKHYTQVKSDLINSKNKTDIDEKEFKAFRDKYQNENLCDLVVNKTESQKIIECDGELFQKTDPVYRESKSFRSHFFAPVKRVCGMPLDTFWANILTIATMTLILYVSLYFDLFRKAIEGIGNLASLINKSKK